MARDLNQVFGEFRKQQRRGSRRRKPQAQGSLLSVPVTLSRSTRLESLESRTLMDATWNVPEPELAFVLNSRGHIVGYTIGNDMSSRDIEGENLLYLPQAKIYDRACALGPFVTVGVAEAEVRNWTISVAIQRGGNTAFAGETSIGQIKRTFAELVEYLFRSQKFPHGAVLLTGTGIVPPEGFTLAANDVVKISISGIGQLENPVAVV